MIALGGTAFAAVSGDSLIKKNSLSGNRLKNHTVTGTQVNLGKLGTVPTATNASSLGGIAASGYTRNDCTSTTGQIKGYALIPASSGFSSAFTTVAGAYNCSNQPVQARRISVGHYEVKFPGSPSTIAVGNGITSGGYLEVINFIPLGPGDFQVNVWNANMGTFQDQPFGVVTP